MAFSQIQVLDKGTELWLLDDSAQKVPQSGEGVSLAIVLELGVKQKGALGMPMAIDETASMQTFDTLALDLIIAWTEDVRQR